MVEGIEIDFLNWQTMVLELIIGGIIAVWFFFRQKKQGDKVEDLVSEIKKITDEQEKSRKKRERWTYLGLISKMEFLKLTLYERKRLEDSLLENKSADQEQHHIDTRTINTLKDLEQTRQENSSNIQIELMPLIENIMMYAKALSENRRWTKIDFTLFEETRKIINELLMQLNAVHPHKIVQPYRNNTDWL